MQVWYVVVWRYDSEEGYLRNKEVTVWLWSTDEYSFLVSEIPPLKAQHAY